MNFTILEIYLLQFLFKFLNFFHSPQLNSVRTQIRLNSNENVRAHNDSFDAQLGQMQVDDLFDSKEDEYMSDSMIKEIGTFHDEIEIDPNESQVDEYCGNFTYR